MMVRKLGLVAAAAALLLASACGGGGGGRPSEGDVSKALRSGKVSEIMGDAGNKLTKDQADCFAKAIVGSDLSDSAVKALVKGDAKYKGDKDDAKALTGISDDLTKCVTG